MSQNKGFILYECLIGLMILCMLIPCIMILGTLIQKDMRDHELTFQKKQELLIQIKRIEANVQCDDTEGVYRINESLCIDWTDVYDEPQTFCEKIWF